MAPQITTVLVDLGGVCTHLRSAKMHLATPNSSITVHRLMLTSTWAQHERDLLTDAECYQLLSTEYGVKAKDVAATLVRAREAIEYDRNMVALLVRLREATRGRVRFMLASNIAKPDHLALIERWGPEFWSIFDHVFTSYGVGHRKPNLAFYQYVLREAHAVPEETLFIDDMSENVFAAMSLGIRGLVFSGVDHAERVLTNALGDPVERGKQFLRANAAGLSRR